MQISVIGGGTEEYLTPEAERLAFEVGYKLAKRGVVVITGGCRGIMECVCKGVKKAGGAAVGILPFCDKGLANKFVDIKIMTGMSYGIRNNLIIHSADAVIVIGGGSGTLSEIALCDMYIKPIVLLEGSGGWSDKLRNFEYLDDKKKNKLIFVRTASEAVRGSIKLAKNLMGRI